MDLFERRESVLLAPERTYGGPAAHFIRAVRRFDALHIRLTAATFYDGHAGHRVLQSEYLEVSTGTVSWYSVPVAQLPWLEQQYWK